MGCTNVHGYNNIYNAPYVKESLNYCSGPFTNTCYPDFDSTSILYNKDAWIDKLDMALEINSKRDCLGYRKNKLNDPNEFEKKYTYLTYGDVSNYSNTLAKNMLDLKLVDKKKYGFEGEHSFVGLFARNCCEWFITDIACQRAGIGSVTFYSTLGDKAFDYIFSQTECSSIFISNDSINNFINYAKEFDLKGLKNVIIFDLTLYADETMFNRIRTELPKLKVYSFKNDLLNKDNIKNKEIILNKSKADDIFTICYTSGTTNLPKGAKLTQNNIASGQHCIVDSGAIVDNNTVHISYLPLAHIMERVVLHMIIGNGGKANFIASGDVKKYLTEDIALTKPTLLIAVPRVLTTFHKAILDSFGKLEGCKKNLVDKAINQKRNDFYKNGTITNSLYDKLVFKKIREKFGGRISYIITGSAPLPNEVGNDIKLFFSVPIVEAYGMTETSGAITVSNIKDTSNSSTGGAVRVNKLKLADRKEMNYHSETMYEGKLAPTGEVCAYGLNIFKGYFLDKEKTNEAFDLEGWIKTGDIGMIMPDNKGLKIIDRVKEIFKLSQGEYIAPSKLENAYLKSKYVLQICVHGDSLKNYLIAIVVPNRPELERFVKEKGLFNDKDTNIENYFNNNEVINEIKNDINNIALANKFNSLEKIQKIIISKIEFNVQNELTTPTLKLVRSKVIKHFSNEIALAYNS